MWRYKRINRDYVLVMRWWLLFVGFTLSPVGFRHAKQSRWTQTETQTHDFHDCMHSVILLTLRSVAILYTHCDQTQQEFHLHTDVLWDIYIFLLRRSTITIDLNLLKQKILKFYTNFLFFMFNLPQENANNTKTYKKKNFMISITIRDSDTCRGPRWGFTEKIYTNFNEL